jgi:hypothetical protein
VPARVLLAGEPFPMTASFKKARGKILEKYAATLSEALTAVGKDEQTVGETLATAQAAV